MSTPSSSSACFASGILTSWSNSCLEMVPLPSVSIFSRTLVSFDFTKVMTAFSFSASATAATTSHSRPISMLSTVKDARKVNSRKTTVSNGENKRKLLANLVMSSRSVPERSKVHIARGILPNLGSSHSYCGESSLLSWLLKTMENVYMNMSSKAKVDRTERRAIVMLLSRVTSSGTERMKRTIRVSRRRRNIRTMERLLKSDEKPSPLLELAAINPTTRGIMTVSVTMRKTNAESKTNHLSRRPSSFLRKAPKRTHHSKVKNTRKKYSPMANCRSA
mmetsp:Transcript_55574/g.119966  ORF Transcript_55574/g.119966 Transcript_55574/m.119966 type:complete len:277 (+) Transcript_55574:788-1618(+)